MKTKCNNKTKTNKNNNTGNMHKIGKILHTTVCVKLFLHPVRQ